ncbi:DUF2314 domain-containing protein [Sinomicrobium pectinilyticum]|uniref:DUF2314 domain-containing protein n=1 Tax=Sinomicrobium pectinilyticum TaxID=1084421 RepID=A0A3N0EKW7_SINP1|nr:DUF2314 domain-containing protein [Sinomicrobium pectinilyticum]RNL88525.1 DUF2314 domain-containing protein [Sinomicrobium pectinilyticum]
MKNKITLLGIIFSTLMFSCSNKQKKVPSGKLNETQVWFEYAIYYPDDSSMNKLKVIELIKNKYSGLEILDSIPDTKHVQGAQIVVKEIRKVKKDFPPPDLDYLKYSGRGLNNQQKEILQTSRFAILLDFLCVEDQLISTMKSANELVAALTLNENDIIWDSETRECFTKDYWVENRLIENNSINISKHITIHLYPKNDYCRAITLGMLKFGLPDICVENLSCQGNQDIAGLINLTAQTLLERKSIERKGKLPINIDLLSNQELKADLLSSLEDNAGKKVELNIVQGTWEEGDPKNKIIEIGFSEKNPQIEHDQLMSKVFGVKDEVTYLNHDEEIMAASQRAKNKIPELHDKFSKGLPLGTHLLMKFPFENYAGEREWMWVEIVKWEGEEIKGLLQNDPEIVKTLKSGQEVTKNIDDMFDYILYFPDGTQEGNETGEIISKQYE